jgi:hypothetical protein
MPRHAKILKISSFHVSPYLAHSLWISMRRFCKGGRTRAKLQAIRRLQRHCGSRKSPVPKAWDSVVRCGPMWSMMGGWESSQLLYFGVTENLEFLERFALRNGITRFTVQLMQIWHGCWYFTVFHITFVVASICMCKCCKCTYLFVCVPGFEAVAPGLQQLGPDHRLHQSIRSFSLTTRNDDHPAM